MERNLFSYINWGLVACTALLFFIGVGNLYSAGGMRLEEGISVEPFYQRQLMSGLLGFLAMLVTMSFDYRRLHNIAWPFFLVALFLLLLVPFMGKTVYGAKRWLSLGFFNIQPSEWAKLAVLVLSARLLARDGEPLGWKAFGQVLAVGAIPAAFILKQPDLGSALMLLFMLAGMLLFHGIRKSIFRICLLAIPLLGIFMWFVGMHDYQRQRIMTFLDPSNDPRGSGYHILQSQIAIGSGELWGKGFQEGTQSQLRFLPEKHSDFALAVLGEEWGFVGCTLLVAIFCLFLLSIYSTTVDARDRFGSMLCSGVFFYFFWETVINMGMVIGLLPVVGIPLPFISYGGSATLVNFTLIGVVLNVSMHRFMFKS